MIELALEERPDGIVVPVRAQPGARRSAIVGLHDGSLKVAVTAPPDKGKANAAIAAILAAAAGLPKSSVQQLTGLTSRQKKFLLPGADRQKFLQAIESLLAQDRG
jgi:uncharacterized protein